MRKLIYRVILAGMCALSVACGRSVDVSDYRFDVVPKLSWDKDEMKYRLELSLSKGMDKEQYQFEWQIDGSKELVMKDDNLNDVPSATTVSFKNSTKVSYWMPDFNEAGDHRMKARFQVGETERTYDWTFSIQHTGKERYSLKTRIQDGSSNGGKMLLVSHSLGTPNHDFKLRFFIDGQAKDVSYGPQTIYAGSALNANFSDVVEYRITLPTLTTGEHSVSMSVEDKWGGVTSSVSMKEDDVYSLNIAPTVNSDGSVSLAVSNAAGALDRTFDASFELGVAQGAMSRCNGIIYDGYTLEGNSMKMNFHEQPTYVLTIPSSMLRPASYRFRITLKDSYGQGESFVSWTISIDQTNRVGLVFVYDQKNDRLMVSSETNPAKRAFTISSMTVGCEGQLTYNPDNWIGRGDEKTVNYETSRETINVSSFVPEPAALCIDAGLLKRQMDDINANTRTHQPKGSEKKYTKHAYPTKLTISMYMQGTGELSGLVPASVTFPSSVAYEYTDGNGKKLKVQVAVEITINGKKPQDIEIL